MPATAVALAIEKSNILHDLKRLGNQFLGLISGCRIKPKGTPHDIVYTKLPKFFVQYGSGIPDSGNYRLDTPYTFDIISGKQISDVEIDSFFGLADRKATEAAVRQKCETPTGSYGYYTTVRQVSEYKGLIKLSDNQIYSAEFYKVKGGDENNIPHLTMVKPIGYSEKSDIGQSSSGNGAGLAAVAGLYFLTK